MTNSWAACMWRHKMKTLKLHNSVILWWIFTKPSLINFSLFYAFIKINLTSGWTLPLKDLNGLGFWPSVTGYWKGSHQDFPPLWAFGTKFAPLSQIFGRELPPKWRETPNWKTTPNSNISAKNAKRPILFIFYYFFSWTEPLKHTPFPKKSRTRMGYRWSPECGHLHIYKGIIGITIFDNMKGATRKENYKEVLTLNVAV